MMFLLHKGKNLKAKGKKNKAFDLKKEKPRFTYCYCSLRLENPNCYVVEIYYIPKIELAHKVKLSIIAQGLRSYSVAQDFFRRNVGLTSPSPRAEYPV